MKNRFKNRSPQENRLFVCDLFIWLSVYKLVCLSAVSADKPLLNS